MCACLVRRVGLVAFDRGAEAGCVWGCFDIMLFMRLIKPHELLDVRLCKQECGGMLFTARLQQV